MVKKVIEAGKRIPRRILRFFFNFDRWHLSISTERAYVVDLIIYLNALPEATRVSVAEIGCGLGDIIGNIKFKNKLGYDRELNVIKAAGFISKIKFNNIKFAEFSFPESTLSGEYNMIIIVNWIHSIEPQILKDAIHKYYTENLLSGGNIIVDTVQASNYKFNHKISYLTSDLPSCEIQKIGDYENQREVFAIIKK